MIFGLLYSILSVVWWLVTLSLILLCIWIVSRSDKRSTKKDAASMTFLMPEVRRRGRVTVYIGLPLILVLGMAGGYAIRDHQIASNVWTYTEVDIKKRVSDLDFYVQPDRMKEMHIRLCENSFVDWLDGDKLDDWTFEQRKGCKRVISYHRNKKGELDAALPIGR